MDKATTNESSRKDSDAQASVVDDVFGEISPNGPNYRNVSPSHTLSSHLLPTSLAP
jgi:hypothetical protein